MDKKKRLVRNLFNYELIKNNAEIIACNSENLNSNVRIFTRFDIDEDMIKNRTILHCLDCGRNLVPCKNKKFRHKFNHQTCRKNRNHTNIKNEIEKKKQIDFHQLAKEIIMENSYINFPASTSLDSNLVLFNEFQIKYDNKQIKEEIIIDNLITDIIINDKNENEFCIEIFYKHNIDEEKIEKISKQEISVLQIDISSIDDFIKKNDIFCDEKKFDEDYLLIINELTRLIIEEIDNKEWIKEINITQYIDNQNIYFEKLGIAFKNNYELTQKIKSKNLFFVLNDSINYFDFIKKDFNYFVKNKNLSLYEISNIRIVKNYNELLMMCLYDKYIYVFIDDVDLYLNTINIINKISKNNISKEIYEIIYEKIKGFSIYNKENLNEINNYIKAFKTQTKKQKEINNLKDDTFLDKNIDNNKYAFDETIKHYDINTLINMVKYKKYNTEIELFKLREQALKLMYPTFATNDIIKDIIIYHKNKDYQKKIMCLFQSMNYYIFFLTNICLKNANEIKNTINEFTLNELNYLQSIEEINKFNTNIKKLIIALSENNIHINNVNLFNEEKYNYLNNLCEKHFDNIEKVLFSHTMKTEFNNNLYDVVEYGLINSSFKFENMHFIECSYEYWEFVLDYFSIEEYKENIYLIVKEILYEKRNKINIDNLKDLNAFYNGFGYATYDLEELLYEDDNL